MLHEQLIKETGGSSGVRDRGLLESAIEAPFQTFDDLELFPTVQEKAARLGFGLIRNHAMVDGNKRIGTHAMLVFLAMNGIKLQYTQKELYTEIFEIAAGEKNYEDLLAWILNNCPPNSRYFSDELGGQIFAKLSN